VRGEPELAPPQPLSSCIRSIIESALAAPGTGWGPDEKYPDLPAKAAALFYALAKSQACPKGNKRVALLLTSAFIQMNGGRLAASREDTVDFLIRTAESNPADREDVVAGVTSWMRGRIAEAEVEQ
jgi:death on curing protein